MIQRIQSVFLFLAAAAGFGVLALPFATTSTDVQASGLFADKTYSTGDSIGLLILFALAGALSLAAIFLYQNRKLQLKIGKIALGADLFGLALAAVLFWQDSANTAASNISGGVGALLPIFYLVFAVLALRAIKKDEALVRSADRLR
jgi:hypothetical protein